ncbi:MAG: succinylglutamate desuccinylase/aspartoacylase family protein [Fuerstiella sp.]
MQVFTFTAPTPGPHLLITAGVHGDEFEPIRAVQLLAERFSGSEPGSADATLPPGFTGQLTLVPCVNEAAFLRGSRFADDDLDLARTCPGDASGSITERTAAELSELIRSADYYIDLHTGGTEFSLYPLAGYMLHKDPQVLEVQRRMAAAFNLPVVWGTSGDLDGRSLSVARDAGVPAIYCEYGGAATMSKDGVNAYVDGCLQVMRELGMLNVEPPASEVAHIVEDDRTASGHLQVCNPSPVTGLFVPDVSLGDIVTAGQPLGTVHELDHLGSTTIAAQTNGLVLMLRTFPRVHKGESVGVVLEVDAP